MSTDNLRLSDSERSQHVEELAQHAGSGRLTIEEFEERAGRIYGARTAAEARREFTDLPVSTLPAPRNPRLRTRPHLTPNQRIEWSVWLGVGAINILIWGIISLATTSMIYPWPLWVIGPWGLALLGRTLLGIDSSPHAIALRHVRALSAPSGTYGNPSLQSTRE
ncbi:DUF1707 domain-containing protein [Rhodococcus sp. NPDC058639]|uniref:DUF1707 SHOCT-like domain-containing protein n=1 Tax=Rhodococcus sp. NPDC058639 TaxID=3346570 RepID=UPI003653F6AE